KAAFALVVRAAARRDRGVAFHARERAGRRCEAVVEVAAARGEGAQAAHAHAGELGQGGGVVGGGGGHGAGGRGAGILRPARTCPLRAHFFSICGIGARCAQRDDRHVRPMGCFLVPPMSHLPLLALLALKCLVLGLLLYFAPAASSAEAEPPPCGWWGLGRPHDGHRSPAQIPCELALTKVAAP